MKTIPKTLADWLKDNVIYSHLENDNLIRFWSIKNGWTEWFQIGK